MGFIQDLGAGLVRMKEGVEARRAALAVGREAKALSDEETARGHPKISVEPGFRGVSYGVRLGNLFGWLWLAFTCVHGAALFYGLSQGSLKMNGRPIEQASWWHFALLGLTYVPFILVGLAFTVARFRLTLTDELVTLRWRILPYVGWTWTLPVGDTVRASLAHRGSLRNRKPVDSVVIASQGKEIHFGAFLAEDVKERLAGLIRHHFGDAPSPEPFLVPPESGR